MYDELVKRIWECASGECFNCSQYTETTNASVCSKELMKQAADAIEELMRRCEQLQHIPPPAWIPVAERLPEKYVNVLVWLRSIGRDSFYYSIDHLMEDGQWWKASTSWKHEVTHWMPLPQPPKEE